MDREWEALKMNVVFKAREITSGKGLQKYVRSVGVTFDFFFPITSE